MLDSAVWSTVPDKYTSDGIECKKGTIVTRNALHYLSVLVGDGGIFLTPTQGKIVKLCEDKDREIWVYFRYGRKPFFLARTKLDEREHVDTIGRSVLDSTIIDFADQMAKDMVVYDRRHIRIDEGVKTPGEPSEDGEYFQSLLEKVLKEEESK